MVVVLGTASCTTSSDSGNAASEPNTVEWKLAVVDEGGYVQPDDPAVHEFANALDVLEGRCHQNTRAQIGDFVVAGQGQLQERGVSESLLTILQAMADPATFRDLQKRVDEAVAGGAISGSSSEGDCAAYVTVYVTKRTYG
jgi:hypothetical protein